MKNVPIKFRAWCAELGKFVYMVYSSSFILYDDEIYFSDQYDDHYKIKTENMDQLVGYDAEGNEVYEGDKLYDAEHDDTVIAELYANVHFQFYKKVDDNV